MAKPVQTALEEPAQEPKLGVVKLQPDLLDDCIAKAFYVDA